MIVAFIATDRPGSAGVRAVAQAAHRAHLDAPPAGVSVRLSGPLLDDAGAPCGSLILFEAADVETVRVFMDQDPNVRAGLYRETVVKPFAVRQGLL